MLTELSLLPAAEHTRSGVYLPGSLEHPSFALRRGFGSEPGAADKHDGHQPHPL